MGVVLEHLGIILGFDFYPIRSSPSLEIRSIRPLGARVGLATLQDSSVMQSKHRFDEIRHKFTIPVHKNKKINHRLRVGTFILNQFSCFLQGIAAHDTYRSVTREL